MKPAPFDYIAPETVEEAVSLLQKYEDEDVEAKVLAGGQSLVPLLNLRMARPDVVVDLGKIGGLDFIREEAGGFAMGAMTSKRTVEESEAVKRLHPLFHEATVQIGHKQIRNRGTVGGSMAQADPAAEYPAAALALGMEFVAVGPEGERTIPADEFFVTYLTTDLDSTEILTEVRIPAVVPGTGWSFQEVVRRHGDFAMAGIAVTLRVEGGVCTDPRIVIFAVGATPLRLAAAEAAIAGQAPSDENFAEAGKRAAAEIEEPIADVHASGEYRRHLTEVLTRRALLEAAGRAGGSA